MMVKCSQVQNDLVISLYKLSERLFFPLLYPY